MLNTSFTALLTPKDSNFLGGDFGLLFSITKLVYSDS